MWGTFGFKLTTSHFPVVSGKNAVLDPNFDFLCVFCTILAERGVLGKKNRDFLIFARNAREFAGSRKNKSLPDANAYPTKKQSGPNSIWCKNEIDDARRGGRG